MTGSLFCVLFLVTRAGDVPAVPHMKEADAVRRATEFCRKIGAPVTAHGSASFPATLGERAGPSLHWQPRWHVVFDKEAEVDVTDGSGVIVYYINYDLSQRLSHDTSPAGQAISYPDAIKRVDEVVAATGQTEQLSTAEVHETQYSSPPRRADHSLLVGRRRMFQGIPFQGNGLSVTLQAETGEVRMVMVSFPTPPPAIRSVKPLLVHGKDRAHQFAVAHLNKRGVKEMEVLRSELVMVQPNTFWVDGTMRQAAPGLVRPAWTFILAEGNKHYAVWVDTETGKVIGGWQGGSLISPPKPSKPAPQDKKP